MQALTEQQLADQRDAAAFRTLMKHCAEMRLAFTRDSRVRQVKLVLRVSSCTSHVFRDEIRTVMSQLGIEGCVHWPEGTCE